jgi:hypothetical protein
MSQPYLGAVSASRQCPVFDQVLDGTQSSSPGLEEITCVFIGVKKSEALLMKVQKPYCIS